MSERIVIDPVTRIEGHAKISIFLDDDGHVRDARFHVVEFRGFERFCIGRPFSEMPGLTARICGICPVSHLIASAKAGDQIITVRVPPAAEKLRRLMNLGQIIQSHALSFFHLSSPDFLIGWDAPAEKRNVFGLIGVNPDLARRGIRLRQYGQEIIEALGGKKIHPAWGVPGGVRESLTPEKREHLRGRLPEARRTAQVGLELFKKYLDEHHEEVDCFGNFPSLFMGLVQPDGTWEHYDGVLRFVDGLGHLVADRIDPARYASFIGEAVEHDSYMKSPYYRPLGYPDGAYRVGPLARLNIADRLGVPRADREHHEFRQRAQGPANGTFLYHYARLIEILAATEHIELLLDDPDMVSNEDPGLGRRQSAGRHRRERGAARHVVPSLRGGRERLADEGQPDRGHGSEQHCHEPDRGSDCPPLHPRLENPRGSLEPGRGWHSLFRPVPELCHARLWNHADAHPADRPRRPGGR